jgi:hypothetical protein
VSGARYRRGLARLRRRVRALARVESQEPTLRVLGVVMLRGVVRCVACGGRLKLFAYRGSLPFGELPIRRLHGRECMWVAGTPPPPASPFGPLSIDWVAPTPST